MAKIRPLEAQFYLLLLKIYGHLIYVKVTRLGPSFLSEGYP
jgi:hypothetical protein